MRASDAPTYMRAMLIAFGIGFILFGATWIGFPTPGRLEGVVWLEDILSVIPGPLTVAMKIGIGWVLTGLTMTFCGFFGERFSSAESTGFLVALGWPLLMSFTFVAAMATGYAPNGINSALIYLIFATPWVSYLFLPRPASTETGSIERVEARVGEDD